MPLPAICNLQSAVALGAWGCGGLDDGAMSLAIADDRGAQVFVGFAADPAGLLHVAVRILERSGGLRGVGYLALTVEAGVGLQDAACGLPLLARARHGRAKRGDGLLKRGGV